jgi:hypothetical protein
MALLNFLTIPTATIHAYQSGGLDPMSTPAERHTPDDDGRPCRHCRTDVTVGMPLLTVLGAADFECLR